MSFKHFELKDIGKVTIYKKRSNKSLRISVSQNNEIKISLPIWTPYAVGLEFARKNKSWIQKNLSSDQPSFQDGQIIGKVHHLEIISTDSSTDFRSRIKGQVVYVYLPTNISIDSEDVRLKIKGVIKKALKAESIKIIKPRLDLIATEIGLNYKNLNIKELKRRWGSCDSKGNITINLYLIQLPWELIDYVLLHELVHTVEMSHDRAFWDHMNKLSPDVKKLRAEIKKYSPVIYNQFD
jgi:hypothetical protein